jgi:SPP1 gp7 family putative phage head morphogenesis protein
VRLADAAAASDQLDFLEGIIVGKAKAAPSILGDAGFLRSSLRVARKLIQGARVAVGSREFAERLRRSSSVDWRGAPESERARAVDELASMLEGLPSEILPPARATLVEEGKRVVSDTRSAVAAEHRSLTIAPVFGQRDERAVEALASSAAVFFADHYERQAAGFRSRAQATIADGLAKGFGRREIAAALREEFHGAAIPESYFETIAAIHVSRARSYSALMTYAEAGLDAYRWVAIGDERRCEVCSVLDGKTFSIKAALDKFDEIEAAKTLGELKAASPFLRTGEAPELPSGKKLSEASPEQIQRESIGSPPSHPRCRCTIVPEL